MYVHHHSLQVAAVNAAGASGFSEPTDVVYTPIADMEVESDGTTSDGDEKQGSVSSAASGDGKDSAPGCCAKTLSFFYNFKLQYVCGRVAVCLLLAANQ